MYSSITMVLVTKASLKKYSQKRVHGTTSVVGGSIWSRIKDFARKIFRSKTVQDGARSLAKLAIQKAPGLIDKGLQHVQPKLPSWLQKHGVPVVKDLLSSGLKLADDKLSKMGMKQDLHKEALPDPVVAQPESNPSVAAGQGIARIKPGSGRRAQVILKRLMKG